VAAIRVLQDLGEPAQIPALVDLLQNLPAGQRDEAIEAVAAIARRGADENQKAGVVAARLTSATKPADRADLRTILGQVGGPVAKRLILAGLGKIRTLAALQLASGFLSRPAGRPEAEEAVVEIGRRIAGAYRQETKAALQPIAVSANEAIRTKARETLALIDK